MSADVGASYHRAVDQVQCASRKRLQRTAGTAMNYQVTHGGVIASAILLFLLSNLAAATSHTSAMLFQGAGLVIFSSLVFLGGRIRNADLYLACFGILTVFGAFAIVAFSGNPFFFRLTRDTLILLFSLFFFTKFSADISIIDRIASILLAVNVGLLFLEQIAPGVSNTLAESLRSQTRGGGFEGELGGERNLFNFPLFDHIQYRRPFGPMLSPVASAYVASFLTIYFHLRRKNIKFLISLSSAIAFTAKGPLILFTLYLISRIRPSLSVLGGVALIAFNLFDPMNFAEFDLHFASNQYLLSNFDLIGAFYNFHDPAVKVAWTTTDNLDTFFSKIMYYSPYLGVAFYFFLWETVKKFFDSQKAAKSFYVAIVALSFSQVEAMSYYNFLLIMFVAVAENAQAPRNPSTKIDLDLSSRGLNK